MQEKQKEFLLYKNYIRWPLVILMILAVLLGLAYCYLIDPVASPGFTMKCVTYEMTGYYCPGCGETRAVHALLHGHILEAFDYNLLLPFVAIVVAYYYFVGLTTLIRKKRVMWIPESVPIWAAVLCGVVIIAFTILRNIPVWPFSILAP